MTPLTTPECTSHHHRLILSAGDLEEIWHVSLTTKPWDNKFRPDPPHMEGKKGCRQVRVFIRPTSFQISEGVNGVSSLFFTRFYTRKWHLLCI